jgi:hypothetical protein
LGSNSGDSNAPNDDVIESIQARTNSEGKLRDRELVNIVIVNLVIIILALACTFLSIRSLMISVFPVIISSIVLARYGYKWRRRISSLIGWSWIFVTVIIFLLIQLNDYGAYEAQYLLQPWILLLALPGISLSILLLIVEFKRR